MSAHHIVPPSTYRVVLLGLSFFMFLTCLAAKWPALEFGIATNLIIALAIAGTKMGLIMTFFMHLKYSSKLVQIFATAALFWLVIMFGLMFCDFVGTHIGWGSPFVEPFFQGN